MRRPRGDPETAVQLKLVLAGQSNTSMVYDECSVRRVDLGILR